ncbi:MAG: phosphate signaling complex protein PhoU [Proteobacteria bacterium]|nr:phosphate signaling complex protein PhoU [Pseudomonadota bacterium]MBU1709165.1 phosphate signaling complex protein PhoU [Pseudomonadota bacterium]
MPKHLEKEIDKLKKQLIIMGSIVEDMVYLATKSVIKKDARMAEEIIKRDIEVDNLEVEIEEDCLKILALHQPVAIDLRIIIAILKINSDLERVGDLAVNIAERSLFIGSQEPGCPVLDFTKMAHKAEGMLSRSIDTLINLDVKAAYRIRAEDEEMDAMNRDIYAFMKEEIPKNPQHVNTLLHLLSVGRHLERIADHATNIAEDVIYLVDARIVRHTPEVFEE